MKQDKKYEKWAYANYSRELVKVGRDLGKNIDYLTLSSATEHLGELVLAVERSKMANSDGQKEKIYHDMLKFYQAITDSYQALKVNEINLSSFLGPD